MLHAFSIPAFDTTNVIDNTDLLAVTVNTRFYLKDTKVKCVLPSRLLHRLPSRSCLAGIEKRKRSII